VKKPQVLHTEISGSGPTVVLLHGYLATSQYWAQLRSKLESTNTVITIDLLGFGKSPKPTLSRYDYPAQLASISATLKHLDVSQPFILMGHSMGALLALRFARLYPSSVKKLLLTNMPIMLTKKEARREIYGTNLAYRLGLNPIGARVMWPLFRMMSRTKLLKRHAAKDQLANRHTFMFQNTAASRLRSFRKIIVAAQTEADLKAITMKTHIISGLHDRKIYLTNLMFMDLRKSLQGNIALHYVDGAHHLPNTQTALLAQLIRS
jgi:pimeloyl-ACP methyl ester carboxylesterase